MAHVQSVLCPTRTTVSKRSTSDAPAGACSIMTAEPMSDQRPKMRSPSQSPRADDDAIGRLNDSSDKRE